ncbi:GTP-binding protein [Pseudomonas sp. 10S4]|uniref:GTP-binding protein n=1 Tax=Pseudomonas sp. 10S4 TaxID=3048583 RepID=UPI002AC9DE94|nr:GTP-binding protein [Pseudomonas sp. 10S4]WPX20795.1 GTP-binding protein [Pseudomonas sp. 10S4]
MSHVSDLISEDILAYLGQHERKEMLRFLTCGNVDDGKSTLIGRLLHDSKMIYEDHLEAITRDSKKSAPPAKTSTWHCWSTACRLSVSRESPSMSRTATSRQRAKRNFILADYPGPRAVHPQHGHRCVHL